MTNRLVRITISTLHKKTLVTMSVKTMVRPLLVYSKSSPHTDIIRYCLSETQWKLSIAVDATELSLMVQRLFFLCTESNRSLYQSETSLLALWFRQFQCKDIAFHRS